MSHNELDELLALEREAPPPDPARAEAVWQRLDRTLGFTPPPTGGGDGGGALGGAGGKLIAAAVVTGAIGGGALFWPREAPPAVAPPLPPPVVAVVLPDAAPPEPPPVEIVMPVEAVKRRVPRPPADDRLGEELAIVRQARAALAAGRVDDALAATARHASEFPLGALAEEREALYVRGLALAGRDAEARSRAVDFLDAYPESIHRAAVQRVLDSL
jgi:hypothetical protein